LFPRPPGGTKKGGRGASKTGGGMAVEKTATNHCFAKGGVFQGRRARGEKIELKKGTQLKNLWERGATKKAKNGPGYKHRRFGKRSITGGGGN